MNGKHPLDTNIIVALFRNEESVRTQLSDATEVFVPAIAIGELYYGARHSTQVEKNLSQVATFAQSVSVLACDGETAQQYGQIKHGLKTKGNPLPENDIWIAAIAMQHSLTVVTRDQHFAAIDGLLVTQW